MLIFLKELTFDHTFIIHAHPHINVEATIGAGGPNGLLIPVIGAEGPDGLQEISGPEALVTY